MSHAAPGLVNDPQETAAEWVDPTTLKPWDRNPKRHSAEAVAKTVASIKRFGFGEPLLARRANREVIAGHRRLKAALKMKLDLVPVRFMDLTEDEAHKLAVADNRHAEETKTDRGELASLLGDWKDNGDDLEDLGFDRAELDKLLGETYEAEVSSVDLSAAKAEFFLSVHGEIGEQLAVLDVIRQHLSKLPVTVSISTTEASVTCTPQSGKTQWHTSDAISATGAQANRTRGTSRPIS